MILLPNYPRIKFSEVFDATTSLIDLGANRCPYPQAQTMCAVTFPVSFGELSANTILAVTGSANNNGPRFRFGDATGSNIIFNGNSTGSAGNPSRTGSDVIPYSEWFFAAATWDGTITATGIRIYYARGSRDLVEAAYGAATNGLTAADYGIGNNIIIGNRGDAGRTFNGSIAYTAWFSGVLAPQELVMVRSRGPNVFRDRMLLCRANGKDYGPYGIEARAKTAIVQGAPPTRLFPLGPMPARQLFPDTAAAAAAFKSRYYYDMAA